MTYLFENLFRGYKCIINFLSFTLCSLFVFVLRYVTQPVCCIAVRNAQIAFLDFKIKICQNCWKLYLPKKKKILLTSTKSVHPFPATYWVAGVAGAQLSLGGEAPTHREGPTQEDKQPLTHALPIHLFSKRMFLGCGRKLENPERTHAEVGRTGETPHRRAPGPPGFRTRNLLVVRRLCETKYKLLKVIFLSCANFMTKTQTNFFLTYFRRVLHCTIINAVLFIYY